MKDIGIPWIKNMPCPYHSTLKLNIEPERGGSFQEEVKIGDLVDIIETKGDESSRSIQFVAGLKQKRHYDYVMLVNNYKIADEEDIQDGDLDQIEIPDIAFYRVLQRDAMKDFE